MKACWVIFHDFFSHFLSYWWCYAGMTHYVCLVVAFPIVIFRWLNLLWQTLQTFIQKILSEGVQLWQPFCFSSRGGRIQIPLSEGQHQHTSEMPLSGVSLECRWWPNIDCWLCSFVIFRGSGPVLLRNPIFLWFFRGGGGGVWTPCPSLWISPWLWWEGWIPWHLIYACTVYRCLFYGKPSWPLSLLVVTFARLSSPVDNLCQWFGPRSGSTKCLAWSGSYCWGWHIFLKDFFKIKIEYLQTTKRHAQLPSMKDLNLRWYIECINPFWPHDWLVKWTIGSLTLSHHYWQLLSAILSAYVLWWLIVWTIWTQIRLLLGADWSGFIVFAFTLKVYWSTFECMQQM